MTQPMSHKMIGNVVYVEEITTKHMNVSLKSIKKYFIETTVKNLVTTQMCVTRE